MSLSTYCIVLSQEHSTASGVESDMYLPGHSYKFENDTTPNGEYNGGPPALSRKLRQQLTDLEQWTYAHTAVNVSHSTSNGGSGSAQLKILLDNAFLVTLQLNGQTYDVESAHIDRTLFQNVTQNVIASGWISREFILLAPNENRLFYVPTASSSSGNDLDLSSGASRAVHSVLPMNTVCDMLRVSSNGRYICARYQRSACMMAHVMYSGIAGSSSIANNVYLQQMGNTINSSPNDIAHFEFSSANPNVFHVIEVDEEHMDDINTATPSESDASVLDGKVPASTSANASSVKTTTTAMVYWSIYEINEDQFLRKHHRRIDIGKRGRLACCSLSPSEHHVCICFKDGSITMYAAFRLDRVPPDDEGNAQNRGDPVGNGISDLSSNEAMDSAGTRSKKSSQKFKHITLNQIPDRIEPFLVKWHPHGGLLMIGMQNAQTGQQELCFFDTGLNLVHVRLGNGMKAASVHAGNIMPGLYFNINDAHFLPPPSLDSDIGYDTVLISFNKGPLVLVQIHWDHMTRVDFSVHPLSSRHLFLRHMQCRQYKEAYSLVRNMHETANAYSCLCALMGQLLREVHQCEKAQALLGTIVTKYGKVFSKDSSQTLSNLFHRYFVYILRQGHMERAFQLAYHIDADSSVFEDIYHISVMHGYKMMAFFAQLHTSRQFQDQLKLLKTIPSDVEKHVEASFDSERSRNLKDQAFIDSMERALSQKHVSRAIENDFTVEETERLAAHLELNGRLSDALKFYRGSSQFDRAVLLFSSLMKHSSDEDPAVSSIERMSSKQLHSDKHSESIINMIV